MLTLSPEGRAVAVEGARFIFATMYVELNNMLAVAADREDGQFDEDAVLVYIEKFGELYSDMCAEVIRADIAARKASRA